MNQILENNLSFFETEIANKIRNAKIGNLELSKNQKPILEIDSIYFHSKHDPILESKRFMDSLNKTEDKKLFLFFGSGLGYTVQASLEIPNSKTILMEVEAGILHHALSIFDYSESLKNESLKIILSPITEESLYEVFRGLASYTVSFIPHKPSFNWKENEYLELKYLAEKFFHKKDANISTLSRFEKVWTRNLIQNLPDLFRLKPISSIFGILKNQPVIVCGAGPSLFDNLENLKTYRNKFILIAVDTSLKILSNANIEPDLIYSVDPQALNTAYLEGYKGSGILVFDPTSSYHSLRLDSQFKKGFFTDSPFPLLHYFTKNLPYTIGSIPFGGSVSTNAFGLAELMGASKIFLLGQDLAFTNGFAHCKGAILEERLNFKESRFFRREKHNYNQIFALPKLKSISYKNEELHTNEKMKIFARWFEDNSKNKNVFNLSNSGTKLENINYQKFEDSFHDSNIDLIFEAKEEIKKILDTKNEYKEQELILLKMDEVILELGSFQKILFQGKQISEKIYAQVQKRNMSRIQNDLTEMDKIDELISSKKGLNEIIGLSVQRTILMITEGYETSLSLDEKKIHELGIAKKSVLLYTGLYEGTNLILKELKKAYLRLSK